jgi:hypothetical protein
MHPAVGVCVESCNFAGELSATGNRNCRTGRHYRGLGFHTSMTYVERRCRDTTDVKSEIAAGIEPLPITAPMRREPYVGISIRVDGQRACRRAGALRRDYLWLCLASRRRSRTAWNVPGRRKGATADRTTGAGACAPPCGGGMGYLASAMGQSFVRRFVDSSRLPVSLATVQSHGHRNLEFGLRIRITRLERFLSELEQDLSAGPGSRFRQRPR